MRRLTARNDMNRSVSPTNVAASHCHVGSLEEVGQKCVEELRLSGFNDFDEEETNVTVLETSGRHICLRDDQAVAIDNFRCSFTSRETRVH